MARTTGTVASARHSRLTAEREAQILAAVLETLADVGYQGLTMPAVAHRAQCSTATIYRRWGGKAGLVIAALRADRPTATHGPDTGSLREDLVAMVSELAEVADSQVALMAALAHASIRDEELATTMREQLTGPAGAPLDEVLDRAVARGEISLTTEVRHYCHLVMISVMVSGHLVEGSQPDRDYLVGFVDAVLVPALNACRP